MNKLHFISVGAIFLISFILFFPAIFVNRPIGLDALGHLSKVSFLKEYSFPNWDFVWYGGSPFLKFYSPLFYYFVSLFDNSFFGASFTVYLSILLTSVGIYLLIFNYTKSIKYSIIFSLFFLTVLGISYYYISVGNHPYVFSLWTLPFSLLFLELSFKNRKFYPLFCILIFVSIFSHIFMGLCSIFVCLLRLLFLYKINIKNLYKILIFILPGILLSAFWLIPFLSHSNSYFEDNSIFGKFIPTFFNLIGLNLKLRWGLGGGSIGLVALLFFGSFFIFIKKFRKDKLLIFLALSSLLFLFFMEGGLGNFYPQGIEPSRFILPFSVISLIFLGVIFFKMNKSYLLIILCFILLVSLVWNFLVIRKNLDYYSHEFLDGEFGYLNNYYETNQFPLEKGFSNYRYGGIRYDAKALNFFYPSQSQISGYYDQGMLFPDHIYNAINFIWDSNDLNLTIYYLDEYGIKYFGVRSDNPFKDKFDNHSNLFKENTTLDFGEYNLTIFEYVLAKPIISYIKGNLSLPFYFERSDPDKVHIYFNYTNNSIVLFKENYHASWNSKEIPSNKVIDISKTENDMMYVSPSEESEGVIFYQVYTVFDKIGIALTLLGLILILLSTNFYLIIIKFLKKYLKK